MKTLIYKISGPGLGLLFSALLATNAAAGPGPQYWQAIGRAKEPAAKQAKPAIATTHACAGATLVAVTQMTPALPNGRGPLVAVQTGTKTVCYMCPVTTTITTNDWPNHRGPLT